MASLSLDLMVAAYFSNQYGYQPRHLEVSESLEKLQEGMIHYGFIASTVSDDGTVHESRNGNGHFDPHYAFATYRRTTALAKKISDPFTSIFLLGLNLGNVFSSSEAYAEALGQEFANHKFANRISLQSARGTLPAFLGRYELRFWKETAHRPFLDKAAEHIELGVQHGYVTPRNISHAAEALFRLGWETLEDRSMAHQERLEKALGLLSRSRAYVASTLNSGNPRLHSFTMAAQVDLQLIRAHCFAGAQLQQLDSHVTNFFDSFNKVATALASNYEPMVAHILEHLLGELHKTFAPESQNGQLLREQLRFSANSLLALMPVEKRNKPNEALDSILKRTFQNRQE